jgi:hypothetical protein
MSNDNNVLEATPGVMVENIIIKAEKVKVIRQLVAEAVLFALQRPSSEFENF